MAHTWEMVEVDGVLYWHCYDDYNWTRLLPVIAGGDDGDGEGEGGEGGEGASEGDDGGDDSWKDFDAERAKSTITKLRGVEKEYKSFKREMTEKFDAQAKQIEDLRKAALSDEEKEKERIADLERRANEATPQLRDLTLENTVLKVAGEVGIADGELALGALDKSAVKWEEGKPTNVKELLEDLLERKPILGAQTGEFGKKGPRGSADGGAGNNGKTPPKLTEEELAMAQQSGMDPEQFAALKDGATFDEWQALQKKS